MDENEPRPSGDHSGVQITPLEDAPENTLALIHVLSLQIGRAFHARIAAEFDVTIAEWRILMSLNQRTGAMANEIAEEWAMEKMAVSRAVRRLERMNRITRRVNSEDRRSYALAMTKAGIRLFERIVPAANARYREITSAATRDELAVLSRVLTKLVGQTRNLAD
jgi:DNA-binding MarR family transcriptional regulator